MSTRLVDKWTYFVDKSYGQMAGFMRQLDHKKHGGATMHESAQKLAAEYAQKATEFCRRSMQTSDPVYKEYLWGIGTTFDHVAQELQQVIDKKVK